MLMGLDRFEAFMDRFSDMPIKFFWFCRAVPQTPMEREDELFSVENLKRLLENPNVMSLGEITRWQEVVRGDAKILEMAGLAKSLRKRVDGHTAGAKYEHLNAIARAGVESCHESISGEEMLERLRLGLYVMLRESSLRQDLGGLLKTVKESGVLTDRMMLTTDSSTPAYYDEWGINDHLIRIAIREGIDPVSAYRMSTINPAVYLGLEHEIGGIAPGRSADIVVLKNLEDPSPEMVMSKGRIIAEEGHLIEPFPRVDWEKFFPAASFSNRTWFAKPDFFQIPSRGKGLSFPVMKLVSPVITREIRAEFRVVQGVLDLKGRPGFCLTALLSRDGKWVSNGILEGFGEGIEGLASTFNTATQILVIGREPEAMSAAVNRVLEIGGGIVAVEQGGIAYELPLPLGGMMSDAPMEQVAKKDREFREFLSKRGYPFHDPLYTLIFLPNDFLPEVRINYRGLVNIRKNRVLRPRRDLAQP
jgi:adenine deaminase